MHCPYCGGRESDVVETRESADLDTIRRRRTCQVCDKRFTNYERVETVNLIVIKRDGRREQFSREKLRSGIVRACDKTTVPAELIEQIVADIQREVLAADSIEIASKMLGQFIATRLKRVDKVAYIRFASVFKRFVDIEDFEKEFKRLGNGKLKV
ncbi:transcriptional regulator NrdR [soil metagenome]